VISYPNGKFKYQEPLAEIKPSGLFAKCGYHDIALSIYTAYYFS